MFVSQFEFKLTRLQSLLVEQQRAQSREIESLRKLIKSREEGSYSDFVMISSRVESLEHQLTDIRQSKESK